jgi:hypothetical protein
MIIFIIFIIYIFNIVYALVFYIDILLGRKRMFERKTNTLKTI